MPVDRYTLTTNREDLPQVIDRHVEREVSRLTWRHTMWNLAWYYLAGARRFDAFDPATGLLRPHFLDEEGRMEYQSPELISAIDRVSGQIASMDLRPLVNRQGNSLTAVRDRAIAQVIGDSVISDDVYERARTEFSYCFSALGCCGIAGHIVDHPTVGLTADLEVVHPRELFPFPSLGQDRTKQRGLVRQRVVPMEWLKERFGRRIEDNKDHMYWWEAEAGEIPSTKGGQSDDDYVGLTYAYSGSTGTGTTRRGNIDLVRIRELWLFGHQSMVDRYILTSSGNGRGYIIEDQDFQGLEVYCPVGVGRFIENNTFHGIGMFDLLFSLSRELERLLKSLFNNVRDTDRYGIVVLPQGQFNTKGALEDVGRGLRVLPWMPDALEPNFRPFSITPFNTGDVPGRTAAFAKQLMDGVNPWQDLLREKGRVDSMGGLGLLDEKIKELMTNATRAVDQAWSTANRSIISAATKALSASRQPIPVKQMTLDLAGAVINPETDEVAFDRNPLPSLTRLSITVRETNPRSGIARKMEALELFKTPGLDDPQRLILWSLEEGIDLAIWTGEERAAYQSIVRNCLLLFGDGEEPGEIVVSPHTAFPDLQLRVLSAFMSDPTMGLASPEVQNAFKRYKLFLLEAMGMALPAAVPNPDDMAQLMTEQEKLQGSPGPPPPGQGGEGSRMGGMLPSAPAMAQ